MQVTLNRAQLESVGICAAMLDDLGIVDGKALQVSNEPAPSFKRFVFVSKPKVRTWITYSPLNSLENSSVAVEPSALAFVGIRPPETGEVRILWIHRVKCLLVQNALI